MARKLQGERGQGRGWACGQMSQRLVEGGLGGVLSKEPVEAATLGLIRGHAQDRGVLCHWPSAPHAHEVLENHLAGSPSCLSWLGGWGSRALWGWEKVRTYELQEPHVSPQQMPGGELLKWGPQGH